MSEWSRTWGVLSCSGKVQRFWSERFRVWSTTISDGLFTLSCHRKNSQTASEANKVSFPPNPVPSPQTNKRFRLQFSDRRAYEDHLKIIANPSPQLSKNSVHFTWLLGPFVMAQKKAVFAGLATNVRQDIFPFFAFAQSLLADSRKLKIRCHFRL